MEGIHIDVRDLAPPDPMVGILSLIEQPDIDDHVIVHLDREPVFLYPELAERGWAHEVVTDNADEVRLLLTRM